DSDASLGATGGVLVISGQISDLGAGHNLTKVGQGQITFARDNTYRGLTTITDGILSIQSPLALGPGGTAANGTIVNQNITQLGLVLSAGTLQLDAPVGTAGFTVLNE